MKRYALICALSCLSACDPGSSSLDQNGSELDLLRVTAEQGLIRVYGASGRGNYGVPVAGGHDLDGDGYRDLAMASMMASPFDRDGAGEVSVVFGNGAVDYEVDTAVSNPSVLRITGDGEQEQLGSELWMADVTGDGLAELLVGRQNYTTAGRVGCGALSIIVGSPELKKLAERGATLDLRSPEPGIAVVTLVGASELDRLGIWFRAGDLDGDGIDDLAVGADQADHAGENSGLVYVLRGGEHLSTSRSIDLSAAEQDELTLTTLQPPPDSAGYRFGATLTIADLDDNGRSELVVAAAIRRVGATLPALDADDATAEAEGGSPGGKVFIAWDDNFEGEWPSEVPLDESAPGTVSVISGGSTPDFTTYYFGEELLGGADYDGDGESDLFVGDIGGDTARDSRAGLGFVFFSAQRLKGEAFAVSDPIADLRISTLLGIAADTISGDTALQGDFDADGIADLAVSSPHASLQHRSGAGAVHVLWGQPSWPKSIELAPERQPDPSAFAITNILGAHGTEGRDVGDTLGYSAAMGDVDDDGYGDLILNEMVGNGVAPEHRDVGNLIVLSGALVASKKPVR